VPSPEIPPLLGLLGALDSPEQVPPAGMRAAALSGAFAVRAPEVPPAAPGTAAGLLAEVSDALDADLAVLDDAAWGTTVLFDWSVRDTVAHLAAVHEVLVERLVGRDPSPVEPTMLDAATETCIRESRTRPPADTLAVWRRSVQRLRHGLEVCDTEVSWLGLSVPAATTIVDRAFETWIHGNDIRNALGRASLDPSAQHLRVLCDLAAELVPLALVVTGHPRTGTLHLALSGPGGGEWTVDLGMGVPGHAELTLNAVARELCLLMGDRIDPRDFAYSVRGGEEAAGIAADLVAAANVFARP
jgi:uncharacterized protein (TIGR03083 family)